LALAAPQGVRRAHGALAVPQSRCFPSLVWPKARRAYSFPIIALESHTSEAMAPMAKAAAHTREAMAPNVKSAPVHTRITARGSLRQLDLCAFEEHALRPGRKADAVWMTCLTCSEHFTWRWADIPMDVAPDFVEVPAVCRRLESLWRQLCISKALKSAK